MEFGGRTFECQSVLRYLSVILDRRLTWRAYIDAISIEATRATNFLRALARVSWGADPMLLAMVYRQIIPRTRPRTSPI